MSSPNPTDAEHRPAAVRPVRDGREVDAFTVGRDTHRPRVAMPAHVYDGIVVRRNPIQPTDHRGAQAARRGRLRLPQARADGEPGFAWSEIEPHWQQWTAQQYVAALSPRWPSTATARDFTAMQRADTFVLVLPCGRRAHLEPAGPSAPASAPRSYTRDGEERELMAKTGRRSSPRRSTSCSRRCGRRAVADHRVEVFVEPDPDHEPEVTWSGPDRVRDVVFTCTAGPDGPAGPTRPATARTGRSATTPSTTPRTVTSRQATTTGATTRSRPGRTAGFGRGSTPEGRCTPVTTPTTAGTTWCRRSRPAAPSPCPTRRTTSSGTGRPSRPRPRRRPVADDAARHVGRTRGGGRAVGHRA